MQTSIKPMGGNQYQVTIGNESRIVDLDGFTVVTDEVSDAMDVAGMDTDLIMSPQYANPEGDDPFFEAAVKYVANFSPYSVDNLPL